MLNKFKVRMTLPAAFAHSGNNFWDDPHISKKLLNAHLDPAYEGASRRRDFIDRSAEWISRIAPAKQYPQILDLGCGPGLYAERLATKGCQVTGVDFSKRSIAYARQQAREKGLDITYYYQNYLVLDEPENYDLALMIYCDYGALAPNARSTLLQNVFRSLKPGGRFLLDVFSDHKYHHFQEAQSWEYCESDGFWSEKSYLCLNQNRKYPDFITLEKTIVVTENQVETYHIWNQYFTLVSLSRELEQSGFSVCETFADVTGLTDSGSSDTIAVLAQKS